MKLMTLNTHSLIEEDYEAKLQAFARGVLKEMPEVIALQEVNQTRSAPAAGQKSLQVCGYVPCVESDTVNDAVRPGAPGSPVIRTDNHAYRLAGILAGQGLPYFWTWTAAKTGYDIYDEGLAVFSRLPILETKQCYITGIRDYDNWKTRKMLGIGISTEYGTGYYYSVHMGWWDDPDEPFREQWERIGRSLPASGQTVWLMGDFNSPAHIRGEGRDIILAGGWHDSYDLAVKKDSGITVGHAIDGWKERGGLPGMRIDYIWVSRPVPVKYSRVVFNGSHYPVVSDHYGIIAEY